MLGELPHIVRQTGGDDVYFPVREFDAHGYADGRFHQIGGLGLLPIQQWVAIPVPRVGARVQVLEAIPSADGSLSLRSELPCAHDADASLEEAAGAQMLAEVVRQDSPRGEGKRLLERFGLEAYRRTFRRELLECPGNLFLRSFFPQARRHISAERRALRQLAGFGPVGAAPRPVLRFDVPVLFPPLRSIYSPTNAAPLPTQATSNRPVVVAHRDAARDLIALR
jgi:hypothetical protein